MINFIVGNNITFYWKFGLLIIILPGGSLKQHMQIINGKMKVNILKNPEQC